MLISRKSALKKIQELYDEAQKLKVDLPKKLQQTARRIRPQAVEWLQIHFGLIEDSYTKSMQPGATRSEIAQCLYNIKFALHMLKAQIGRTRLNF